MEFSIAQKIDSLEDKLLRATDANLNRLREGLRVVEDICRYIFDDAALSSKTKNLRHLSRVENYSELLNARDIINDCSKQTTQSELSRVGLDSLLLANFKRAQESARVLEEIMKIENPQNSQKFKSIRYELYDLEKEVINKTSNSK